MVIFSREQWLVLGLFKCRTIKFIAVDLLGFGAITRCAHITVKGFNFEPAFKPIRLPHIAHGDTAFAVHVNNLVGRWWRYMDAGAKVGHQQKLSDSTVVVNR